MTLSADTPRDNLTLSEADLATCHPIVGEGGHVLRALCPFHGSDRQRSLRVQVHSGRFVCFACGAWGYMDTARTQWREEQHRQAALRGKHVEVLPAAAYGGCKDVSDAWATGVLAVDAGPAAVPGGEALAVPPHQRESWAERTAIMVIDGGLPHADAERLAWAGLQTPGAAP